MSKSHLNLPFDCQLYLASAKVMVEAEIFKPSASQIRARIEKDWWEDPSLKNFFQPDPIDRHWSWTDSSIDFEGIHLPCQLIAIRTGDGEVQGVMLVSIEAVPSGLSDHSNALFIERLFTAPRNRPSLRVDGMARYLGVGLELIRYAVRLSQSKGHGGCVRLDGSPDFIVWYNDRGFECLNNLEPIAFEGVEYTPMAIPPDKAESLLTNPKVKARKGLPPKSAKE